jgi:hypothetical protein
MTPSSCYPGPRYDAVDLSAVLDAMFSECFGKGINGSIRRRDGCEGGSRVEGGAAGRQYD